MIPYREELMERVLGWTYDPLACMYTRPDGEQVAAAVLQRLTEDDWVRLVEDAIEQRGLVQHYIETLYNALTAGHVLRRRLDCMSAPEAWLLLRASGVQRCDAALRVVGDL